MESKRHLFVGPRDLSPALTYLSTACAMSSIGLSMYDYPKAAAAVLVASGILDSFDGRFASRFDRDDLGRTFGMEIDSISDMAAFGVAPAILVLSVSRMTGLPPMTILAMILACAYALAAACRLAWFGALSHAGKSHGGEFRGVPVTYSALVMPLLYAMCVMTGATELMTGGVLAVCEGILAFLFVWDVPVPRPPVGVLVGLSAIGIASAGVLVLG